MKLCYDYLPNTERSEESKSKYSSIKTYSNIFEHIRTRSVLFRHFKCSIIYLKSKYETYLTSTMKLLWHVIKVVREDVIYLLRILTMLYFFRCLNTKKFTCYEY